ncbi:MAG: GNAT family N-acetyltransferase [Dehalococcoidia bacterium]
MTTNFRLSAEPEASPKDEQLLRDRVAQWNVDVTGHRDYAPATFFIRDEDGTIRGGVLSYVWGRRLHVDILWIDEDLRGSGWGTKLIEAAHTEGRSKGAIAAYLDTFDWQARPFYERLGYKVVAEVTEVPEGHARFYMLKSPL